MNAKTLANTLTSAEKITYVLDTEAEMKAAPSTVARCAAARALLAFHDHDGYQTPGMRPAEIREFLRSV